MRPRLATPMHIYSKAAVSSAQATALGAAYDLLTVNTPANISNLQSTIAAGGCMLGFYEKGANAPSGFTENWYAHDANGARIGPNSFGMYSIQMDDTTQAVVSGTAYNGWKPYHAQHIKDDAASFGSLFTAPLLDSLGSDFTRCQGANCAVIPGTSTLYTSVQWAALIWQIVPAVRNKLGTSLPWTIIVNGTDRGTQAQWTKCDVLMNEGWFGSPSNFMGSHNSWINGMSLAIDVAAAGVQPWLYVKLNNTDWGNTALQDQARNYGLASYLIAFDTTSPAYFTCGPAEGGPPPQTSGEYNHPILKKDPGTPTETYANPQGYFKVGTTPGGPGIYSRLYSQAVAIVNTDTAPHNFTMPAGSFTDPNGAAVTTTVVTIPAKTGIVYYGTTQPPGSAPAVTLGTTKNIGQTSATLNGTVNPNNSATTYQFEYGLTTGYGSTSPATPASAGAGNVGVAATTNLTGLTPGTTYHYRLSATNAFGTTHTADATFTTTSGSVPIVAAQPATAVSDTTATLHATVNPNGSATSYHFDYGEGPIAVKDEMTGVVDIDANTFSVAGVEADTLHVNWSELEALDQGGTLNGPGLARITTMINNAQAAGLTWKLRLFCNGARDRSGNGMPSWLKTLVGTFTYADPFDATPTPVTLGKYWPKAAQDHYRRLILNLAVLLDNEPTLRDVTVSGAMTLYAEPLQLGLSAPENRAELVGGGNGWAGTFIPVPGAGFTHAQHIAALHNAIDAHAQYFVHTNSSFAFNPMMILTDYNTFTTEGSDLTQTKALIDYAALSLGDNFIPENNSARPDYFTYSGTTTTPTGFATGTYPNLYQYFMTKHRPIFMQTATPAQIINATYPTSALALEATMNALIDIMHVVAVEPHVTSAVTDPGWSTRLAANYTPPTPTPQYGLSTATIAIGSGSSPISVAANVTGLTPGSTIHFRAVATNAAGTGVSGDQSFAATVAPVPTLAPATVTPNTAVLAGTIDTQGGSVQYQFVYGQTAAYGSATTMQTLSPAASPVDVFANISGLQSGTTYHYALIANGVQSADGVFTTTQVQVITESYLWENSSDGGATWQTALGNGADTNTYTVDTSDLGDLLRCVVKASDGEGHTATVTTTPVGPVTARSAAIIYGYQWQHSSDQVNWTPATGVGATSATYTTDPTDATLYLRVRVAAVNQYGSTVAYSNALGPVVQPSGSVLTASDTIHVTVSPGGGTLTATDQIHVTIEQGAGGPFAEPWAVGTKIPAWLRVDGKEIANWARTSEYMNAGFAGSGLSMLQSCGCSYLYNIDGVPHVFQSPSLDPAPWYDPTRPESTQFLGLVVNNITQEPVTKHAAADVVGRFGGSVLSPAQTIGKRVTVSATMVSASCSGAEYGYEWLKQVLGDPGCDSCALSTVEMREVCPPSDGSDNDLGYWLTYRMGITDGPTLGAGDNLCNLVDVTWTWISELAYAYKKPVNVLPSATLAPPSPGTCIDFVDWFCGVGAGLRCATIQPPVSGVWGAIVTIYSPDGVGGIDIATYTRCPPDIAIDVPESEIRILGMVGTLVIDSSRHEITYTDLNGVESDGTAYVYVPTGSQLEWIEVEDCDNAKCLCISQSYPCAGGEATTVTMDLQYRRR